MKKNTVSEKVFNFIKKENLLKKNDQTIIAVSGGIDSTVLLDTIFNLKSRLRIKEIIVVHVNHCLRGKESDRDEKFVKEICENIYGIKCITTSFDIKNLAKLEINKKFSKQEVSRKYRLMFLKETAEKHSCTQIITGHNMDDSVETVLMWISRGTGIKGASGILPKRDLFIRPLLTCSREEIQEYARVENINFIEDSSNQKLDYIRNKFRHKIIPEIQQTCYPNANYNIARFSELMRDDADFIDTYTDSIFYDFVQTEENQKYSINIKKLFSLHKSLNTRIIRKMIKKASIDYLKDISLQHIKDIIEICTSTENGQKKYILPNNLLAITSYGKLTITQINTNKKEMIEKNKNKTVYTIDFPGYTEIKELGIIAEINILPGKNLETITDKSNVAFIDYDKIKLPLKLRTVKQGDTFAPLGTMGQKKLSDFFIDSKIPVDERWNSLLIEDKENILWLINHRISEIYRVKPTSGNVVQIKIRTI